MMQDHDSTPASPRLVILESPFAGDVEANVAYARRCVRDALMRGEAPIASHLLYTQPGILDDTVPAERAQGIAAGLAWRHVAQASVVYADRGISPGMREGIKAAREAGRPVEVRYLDQPVPTIAKPPAWQREQSWRTVIDVVALAVAVMLITQIFRWYLD